jgi:Sortase domain
MMNAETSHRRRQYAVLAAVALATVAAVFLGIGLAAQTPAPPRPPAAQPAAGHAGDAHGTGGNATDAGEAEDAGKAKDAGKAEDAGAHGMHAPATNARDRSAGGRVEGLAGPSLPVSEPRRIRIPKLGVDSTLEELRLDAGGRMTTPREPVSAGWYAGGPTPGAPGPAVIAGHVTWDRRPAVFFDLAELRAGDRIEVDRSDGTTAVFSVTSLEQYDKSRFPTRQVYGSIDHAGLRLITCGGEYDDRRHRYDANIVAFATLVGA